MLCSEALQEPAQVSAQGRVLQSTLGGWPAPSFDLSSADPPSCLCFPVPTNFSFYFIFHLHISCFFYWDASSAKMAEGRSSVGHRFRRIFFVTSSLWPLLPGVPLLPDDSPPGCLLRAGSWAPSQSPDFAPLVVVLTGRGAVGRERKG